MRGRGGEERGREGVRGVRGEKEMQEASLKRVNSERNVCGRGEE